MNAERNAEIIDRLVNGKRLDGLGLEVRDGRLDLRGLVVPKPVVVERFSTPLAHVAKLQGLIRIKGRTWDSLDFSESVLSELQFIDCTLRNCAFERCQCEHWKLWTSSVENCNFRKANLRRAVLGPVADDRRNTYRTVDFIGSDLQRSIYDSAEFTHCDFSDANLTKVEFNGSIFDHCRFRGELREVIFAATAFDLHHLTPNEMRNVDFREARLRWCEFRKLNLETVQFPENDEHIVVDDYRSMLQRVLQAAQAPEHAILKEFVPVFENKLKWAGPSQRRGVFNKQDLLEMGGEEGLRELMKYLSTERKRGRERGAEKGTRVELK